MENTENDFKKPDLGDFGNTSPDLDDGINVMDQVERANEEAFKDEFASMVPSHTVTTDVGEEAPILGKEEMEKSAEVTPEVDEKEEEKSLELNDEAFDQALTAEEQKDLDDLNKRLGTSFKDMKSLKDSFKKEEKVDEVSQEIDKKRDLVGYLEQWKEASDRDVVLQDLRVKAHNNGENVNDPEVIQRLEEEVGGFEANGTLPYMGQSLKATLSMQHEKYSGEISKFDESQQLSAKQIEEERKETLKGAVTKLYQREKFYGLEVSQEEHMTAYRDATNKKLIQELESNPELLVEMTLLRSRLDDVAKVSESPSYNAGVKAALDRVKGGQPTQSAKVRNNQGPEGGLDDFIASFVM